MIETAKRKKSRGHNEDLNVFQFAETVEEGAWDDEKQKKDLEVRVSFIVSIPNAQALYVYLNRRELAL